MRSLSLLPALAAICCAQAQQINGYRYWFNDDMAAAVTTSVGAVSELVLAANWPTSGLSPGFHKVSVQVRDNNGDWSAPRTSYFTRGNQAITGYRYWVNNSGTATTGTAGPNADLSFNGIIAPSALTNDFNTVCMQFRDADGEWSVPHTAWFVKNTGLVNGYEYWIDDDIANSNNNTIGPSGVVDLIADLPTGVPAGDHTFTIRFSGANGTWSVPLTTAFSSNVSVAELPGLTDLLLFPNPVTNQLGLRLSSDATRTLKLEVLDLSGAVVNDLNSWSVSGTAYRNWDISELASGSYLLRVAGDNGTWTTRFVKP